MPTTGRDRRFYFKSRSNPEGRKYVTLVEWKTGRVTCTCPGWTYHQKCWHVERVIDQVSEVGYDMGSKR